MATSSTEADLLAIANWKKHYDEPVEIPHHPARVLMQDFTGVSLRWWIWQPCGMRCQKQAATRHPSTP
ncbi:MAG: hypothetical protein U5K27_01945 [Desulfotignum sp.]|nr:hypothetical protein [Desulfotignum sp.]